MFDAVIVCWMLACLVWLATRIPPSLKASKGDGPAATVGAGKLQSKVVTAVIVLVVLLVQLGHWAGLVSNKLEAEVFAVALASAATFQIITKELTRARIRKQVRDETRPRVDPPATFRVVEGGAGSGSGPDGEEGSSEQDGSRDS